MSLRVTPPVTNQIAYTCWFPLMTVWSANAFHAQFGLFLISVMKSSQSPAPWIRPVGSTHGSSLLHSTFSFPLQILLIAAVCGVCLHLRNCLVHYGNSPDADLVFLTCKSSGLGGRLSAKRVTTSYNPSDYQAAETLPLRYQTGSAD